MSRRPSYHGTCACGKPGVITNKCRPCYQRAYDEAHKPERRRRLRGYVATPRADVRRIQGRAMKWPQELVRVPVAGWGVKLA